MAVETKKTEVLVLGSGPGGYTAAFRSADLGKKVILVEKDATLGGVCLNVGCIPSKALLHAAKVIEDAAAMAEFGVEFGNPKIDINKLRAWKDSVVKKLTGGLSMLAKQRKVEVIQGEGKFTGTHELTVKTEKGEQIIQFEQAIIAAGSQPVRLPFLPDDPRIIDSTGALELKETKGDLLILGGGIIGMEMATVYHALGAAITVVEGGERIIAGADEDIVKPLAKRLSKHYKFLLKTKVTKVEAKKDGLWVSFEGENAPDKPQRFDRLLSAVGRKPNGKLIGAEALGIEVTEQGFITVDNQLRTNVANIFAIGDIVGNPMLAHKAVAEGRVAAEVIAGKKHFFEPRCIPAVAYTDPEIAWVGLTEMEAKEKNISYEKAVFPWMASGRSLGQGRDEGLTKLLFDPKTQRVLGAGIVGPNAGELIAEIALAIEMGCEAEDIALTIHPHPTLSETVMLASEIFEGTITDLYMPKKKK
jgi:dihydrolipoamide dehydrogenase